MNKESFSVHQTAVIDNGAQIGEGTRIWHWTHVCAKAVVGKNCSLGQNVFVGNKDSDWQITLRFKNNVSIYDGVTLEDKRFLWP